MTGDATDETRIQATGTSLALLEEIRTRDGAQFSDLVDAVSVSKSTVHHHLATLLDHEVIVEEEGTYHVGLRLLEYGGHARRRQRLYQVCKPQADKLAAELDETVQLVVEEHGHGSYIYRTGDDGGTPHNVTGRRTAIHATASGKAILSELPESRVDSLLQRIDLSAQTDNTITDPAVLKAELAEVRDQGYALDDEESVPGVRCVAKPVVTSGGTVLGAVGVTGTVERIDDERFQSELPEHLTNTAAVAQLDASYSSVIGTE